MAGVPAAIATSGGTRKPFSYCPGGIDFSELKSPKMAKRIAKHQSGMTAAPPSAPSPTMVSEKCIQLNSQNDSYSH